MELFYIKRGCNSRTEIWERETKCKTTCIQAAFSTRTNLVSPLPALPLHPSHTPPINAIREASCVYFRPPLPHPRTPHCWIWTVFSDLGQKRGRPLFRGLKVLQLNLDSFCDHVRIFGAVIGHLGWDRFLTFPQEMVKIQARADILTSRAGTTANTVRERRRPYKLGGLSLQVTWGLHEREATSPEWELFSQT